VRATFFLLGLAAERHPAISGAGHGIAVLGFRLPDVRGELARALTSINAATGTVPYRCRARGLRVGPLTESAAAGRIMG